MYENNKIDAELYCELMEQIKKVNQDWLEIRKSNQYRYGLVICELKDYIKRGKFRSVYKAIKRWTDGKKSSNISSQGFYTNDNGEIKVSNNPQRYFQKNRVAIYTAVFGEYDDILEPYIVPDNCDFFLITDNIKAHKSSVWKTINPPEEITDYSNAEKNRYIKMHPHLFFSEYKYSIYIDGNIQVITDLTEYVNLLGEIGIATHIHDNRFCIYDELEAVKKTQKDTIENINRHKNYLLETEMPKNYGLLQCSVIVREHNNTQCISIMEEWWEEYMKFSKRDQISLPHVLYRHGIEVREVGVLGCNVYKNPSFRINIHK